MGVFGFGWGDHAEGGVQSSVVRPVDPHEGGVFDVGGVRRAIGASIALFMWTATLREHEWRRLNVTEAISHASRHRWPRPRRTQEFGPHPGQHRGAL
jgi:hypothetical protein